jgi:NADH-quinone oxidoreductase subunit J
MLDVDFASMRQGFLQYMPIGVIIGVIMFLELLLVAGSFALAPHMASENAVPIAASASNIRELGDAIYTRYVFVFQAAGGVLLVAMMGAIVLTLRHKTGVKRQDIFKQSNRTRAEATELVKVKSGQGL